MPSAITYLGPTNYTPQPTFTYGVTVNSLVVSSNLNIRTGPSSTYGSLAFHNRVGSGGANQYWDVRELYNNGGQLWAREWFSNQWAWSVHTLNGEIYSNISPYPSCSPGQIRVSGITVTATRSASNDPIVSLSMVADWHCASGTIENYHDWVIYVFAHSPKGGEGVAYIHNTTQSVSAGTGISNINFNFSDTSGASSIYCGKYGLGAYALNNKFGNAPGYWMQNDYTINIPPYSENSSPIYEFKNSTWNSIPITDKDGTALRVSQFNGTNWIQI